MATRSWASVIVPKKKDRLGVALVGLGYYSTDLLAPALQLTTQCRLAGVVSGTPAKLAMWQQRHGLPEANLYNYDNFDTIANNTDIDVVYIVLPPSMHAEYTIRAARAGKHVWCEKPMAPSVKECEAMIKACRDHGVTLAIGYRLHHEPNTQRIMQFRREQKYGPAVRATAEAGYVDPRKDHWKQKKAMGGGVMGDMGVYPLNAIRYGVGLEPIAVTAQASTTRPEIYTEVEETMAFQLEFPGGATAAGEASFGKRMNRLRVGNTQGWYELSPFQNYSGIKGTTSDGVALDAVVPNQQAKQMDDDAAAIMHGTPLLAPGEEGLKDTIVVEAIYRAASSGQKEKVG
ncbi:Glucose--fructose oxidoreductase precursor [Lacunisphaera limnophila]|uniref:Glucose--fructose oxidoreductase n=2 Tax=Lacunisphaera limnophila TaxID=1838286 RepID=A0A1D8AUR6_9BACT|nr:Glucose--fructose oxidoreductase precursor [Lacunisphaera limnophila]